METYWVRSTTVHIYKYMHTHMYTEMHMYPCLMSNYSLMLQIFEWCQFMLLVGSEDTSNDHDMDLATNHISDTVISLRCIHIYLCM